MGLESLRHRRREFSEIRPKMGKVIHRQGSKKRKIFGESIGLYLLSANLDQQINVHLGSSC